jgi:hypothetical protein
MITSMINDTIAPFFYRVLIARVFELEFFYVILPWTTLD